MHKPIVILSLILIATSQLFSQSGSNNLNRKDLQEVYVSMDSITIQRIAQETINALRSAKYNQADSLSQVLFRYASLNRMEREKALSLRYRAIASRNLNEYDEAIEFNLQSIEIAKAIGDLEIEAAGYGNLSNVYSDKGYLEKAIVSNFNALALYDTVSNELGIANTLNNIAIVYSMQGNETDAVRYYRESLKFFARQKDSTAISDLLVNLSTSLLGLSKLEAAKDTVALGMNIARAIDNPYAIANAYGVLAEIAFIEGKTKQAIEFQWQSLNLHRQFADERTIAESRNSLVKYLLADKKSEEALTLASQNLKNSSSLEMSVLIDTYFHLSEIYENKQNYKEAIKYFKLASNQKDSLASNRAKLRTAELRELYESEKKEKRLQQLEREKAMKEIDTKEERSRWLAAITFFGLVAIGSAVLIFIKTQNQKRLIEKNAIIQKQRDDLEEANQIKNEFLGIASHDLKNPLQTIMGFTSIMKERNDNPNLLKYITPIETASERMLNLINELLSTAAIESGNYALNLSNENLTSIIEASINNCSIIASKKNIQVQLRGKNNVQIQCDGLKIQEVFENLISNAIKYSLPDSKVEITVENYCQNSRDGFLIHVKDQGLGMTEEDLKKLFGRFQRLSARPTGGEASTGLGLSIVKKIIELHGGTVSASSEGKGLGTEFQIFLPSSEKAVV